MAAITSKPARPEYAGQIFNLTGPAAFAGDDLAAVVAFARDRGVVLLGRLLGPLDGRPHALAVPGGDRDRD